MARSSGPLGPANGKISRMVFYQLNGQQIIRGLGEKKKFTSEKVLAQNQSMRLLMQFFNKIKPFIKAGFKNDATGTIYNYHNLATAHNRTHAIAFRDNVPYIRFEQVLLSRGTAPIPQNPTVALSTAGLQFSWSVTDDLPWITNQDQVMILAWFPEVCGAIYSVAGASRQNGTDLLPLPASYQNLQMETYIAFVSQDRESVSNSIYMGSISNQH